MGQNLSAWFEKQGVPTTWAYVVGVGLIVTAITYLSLIIGELVPKQIALRNPEKIACKVAPAMSVLAIIAYPVVWLLDWSGKIVLSLMRHKEGGERSVTEEEIKTLVAEAESAGVLEPGERQMISSVMRLGDRSVRGVMTPRVDVEMVDLSAPISDALETIAHSAHSRFPAHDDNPDVVTGVLWAKDLVSADWEKPSSLTPFVRPAPTIPADFDALDVVEILRRSSVHMGIVRDEYGSFLGIVTAADILEAIVGVFAKEGETLEEAIVTRDDGSLLIAGWMPVGDMAEALGVALPENRSYETAAGMLSNEGKLGEDEFEFSEKSEHLSGHCLNVVLPAHNDEARNLVAYENSIADCDLVLNAVEPALAHRIWTSSVVAAAAIDVGRRRNVAPLSRLQRPR